MVPVQKAPKYYPADDVVAKKVVRKTHYAQKLKSKIMPGSVLILLVFDYIFNSCFRLDDLPENVLYS
jgi:large subunit ribosomal protein L6e